MKHLLAILFAFSIVASKDVKPLAKGVLDTVSGLLSVTGDCPTTLGGKLEELCIVSSKCNDTTCTQSMSSLPGAPGTDHGGAIIQILPVEYCETERTTIQDSIFLWMKGRALSNQWACLDSVRASVNSRQDTTNCYLSVYDQFTNADKLKMTERKPFIDSLISPIALWLYTCED